MKWFPVKCNLTLFLPFLPVGTLLRSQIPSFSNLSRISQLNIPGFSRLYSSILFSTSGVVPCFKSQKSHRVYSLSFCHWGIMFTHLHALHLWKKKTFILKSYIANGLFDVLSVVHTLGLLPPMAPGLMEPVSWYRHRILDTQPWETRSCLEMTHGLMPWWAISTILCRMWLGRGLPFMKTPPSWFTRPWPSGVDTAFDENMRGTCK